MFEDIDQLLAADGFQAGLVASAIVIVLIVALQPRVRWIGWSLAALAGTVVGWRVESYLPDLVLALVLLAVAGALGEGRDPAVRIVLAVPGAFVLAQELPEDAPTWMRVVLVAAVAVAPVLVWAAARSSPRIAPALLFGTSLGIYVCVPETGPIPTLVGALAPVGVAALALTRARVVDPPALWPLVGAMVWAAVDGGATRPGSVVGGIACLGVLAIAPLVRWRSHSLVDDLVLLAVDIPLVMFVAREAGFRQSTRQAAVLSAAAFVIAAVVLLVFGLVRRRAVAPRPAEGLPP